MMPTAIEWGYFSLVAFVLFLGSYPTRRGGDDDS